MADDTVDITIVTETPGDETLTVSVDHDVTVNIPIPHPTE